MSLLRLETTGISQIKARHPKYNNIGSGRSCGSILSNLKTLQAEKLNTVDLIYTYDIHIQYTSRLIRSARVGA